MLRQYYANTSAKNLLSKPGVLAVISFDEPCHPSIDSGTIPIGIRSLSGLPLEVIEYSDQVAQRGVNDGCHWSSIGDVMCVATWMTPEECRDIKTATENGYNRLLQWVHRAGFPHPFRIWNFIPNINQGDGDCEEYKQFCVGRQHAFDRSALSNKRYPAASALGHHSTGGVIYMLASRVAGQHHENPKQQPAYEYPRKYGPCSPSFARATSIELQSTQQIMVSGTASILGHDTQAAGDLEQQLAITLENIRCLQRNINANASDLSAVRVYLRHVHDFPAAEAFLTRILPKESMNFVHADICRKNLLVEIEAVASEAIR